MTVLTSANKAIIAGDGVKTAFGFSFNAGYAQNAPSPALALSYLAVLVTDAGGNITTVAQGAGANQCQITLTPPAAGALWGLGGSVAYNPGGVPVPLGSTVTIARTVPLTQIVSLSNQGGLFPQTVEMAMDLLEFQVQQLGEQYARALVAPIVDASTISLTLPPAAQRANAGLAFDGAGNVIAGTIPATGLISTAMQPVVNAASVVIARTALGLGAMATEGIGGGLVDDGAGNARVIFKIQQVAINQAIDAGAYLNKFIAGAAVNFTLNQANTLWSGFGFWVDATAGAVTLIPNAADTIQAQTVTSGAAVTIPSGASVFVKTNGNSTWWLEWMATSAAPVAIGSSSGLRITNNVANPNDHIDVSANALIVPNTLGGAVRATSFAATINLNAIGVNGLDVGSLGASAVWLYIFAISNGISVAALASISSTAPTLPAGYTFVNRIGAMRWNGSGGNGLLRTLQRDRIASYVLTSSTNTPELALIGAGTTGGAMNALSILNVAPLTAIKLRCAISVSATLATQAVAVAPNASYTFSILSGTGNPPVFFSTAGAATTIQLTESFDMLLESTNIYYGSTVAASALYCVGWEDSI